jgi:perosamine synthetase
MRRVVPINEPLFAGRELEYVSDCIESGWISSSGRFVGDFESGWASYCGRRHGVAMSNGTVALQAAVAALDLAPGDEVLMPTFTIISCAAAVLAAEATPVLVDSDPRTWCMDVEQVRQKITDRTRAIMAVHIYGHPVDMDPLHELAETHGLALLEDAAEAHGAEYKTGRAGGDGEWRRCGSFGAMSCFSFYANKIVTTGEGGMVLTDDDRLAERLRSLRNLCFDGERRFLHEEIGFNFRLTNLQAAVGVAQIERVAQVVERKREVARRYGARLRTISALQLPVEEPWARNVYWMYGVVVDEASGLDAAALGQRLGAEGVETRPFFLGMHEQPVLRRRGLFDGESYPVAERLARQGLYLPSGTALTDAQVDEVCDVVADVLS